MQYILLFILSIVSSCACATPLYVNLVVNGAQIDGIFFAEIIKDSLIISDSAWYTANLKISSAAVNMINNTLGYEVDQSEKITYKVDQLTQTVYISADADLFNTTDINSAVIKKDYLNVASPGAYLNYAVTGTHMPAENTAGISAEAIAFNHVGSVVTGFSKNSNAGGLTRTTTYFQKDMPDSMQSIVIGDALSSSSTWSRSVRFGGIAWSSDFRLNSSFVTAVPITILGSAVVPSTVDLLINNQRQLTSSVGSGPFRVQNTPLTNGEGQVSVVVRDALGNEKVTLQKFYSSSIILAPGISTFSYEAGFLRTDHATTSGLSNRKISTGYSNPLATATQRAGMTDFTLEQKIEVQSNRQAVGASVATVIAQAAVVNAAIAATNTASGVGYKTVVGIERSTSAVNFSAQVERHDAKFIPLGHVPHEILTKNAVLVGAGFEYYKGRWLNLNLINKSYWSASSFSMASLNMLLPVNKSVNLGIYANRRLDASRNFTVSLILMFQMDGGSNMLASSNSNAGRLINTVQYNAPLAAETGSGYSVTVSDSIDQSLVLSTFTKTSVNSMTADVATSRYGTVVRAGTSGSVGIMNNHAFASPRIDHAAFAMVNVANEGGVDVYLSNQKVASTNSAGHALVSPLEPYAQNIISIHAEDLPLNLDVNELTKNVSPFARSGVVVDFDIKKSNNRLLQLLRKDGSFVQSGSTVYLLNSKEEFFVAKRGMVYLQNIKSEVGLTVTLPIGALCKAELLTANDIVVACDTD